jgi:hypothetical protein
MIRIYLSRIKLTLLLLFAIIVSGCQAANNAPPDMVLNLGVTKTEVNTRLKLTAPDKWNDLNGGLPLGLLIDNVSDGDIEFDPKNGVKLFVYEDDQWKEIDNIMDYPEGKFTLTPSKGDFFKMFNINLFPDLPVNTTVSSLRIVIIGKVVDQPAEDSQMTGAYIDISLK